MQQVCIRAKTWTHNLILLFMFLTDHLHTEHVALSLGMNTVVIFDHVIKQYEFNDEYRDKTSFSGTDGAVPTAAEESAK